MLAGAAAALAAAGVAQGLIGYRMVRRFRSARTPARGGAFEPITVMKPLYGAEPLLEEALSSVFAQDYPAFQVVLGVQDAADPAIEVVRRVQARFPHRDSTLVIDRRSHGRNRKIGNLANMLPYARHGILVIADSDVHARPDYLTSIARAFGAPGIGLVTTVYTGLPASGSWIASLGATGITHGFLPGALIGRRLGREDCLGATMAIRRETLDALGGFGVIADDLADDAALGRAVRALGLHVALADTVPATTVPETRLPALFWHELRWARVIRSQVPGKLALSTVQYPLAWAGLAVAASGGAAWSFGVFAAAWLGRAATGRAVDRALGLAALGLARPVPVALLPLRDLLSLVVVGASYLSTRVRWRGQVLNVGPGPSGISLASTP